MSAGERDRVESALAKSLIVIPSINGAHLLRRILPTLNVPGDCILVAEGERVAADAVLREATALQVDESLLTGESAPVTKSASQGPPRAARAGGDGASGLFAGTLVVAGHGVAEVVATGRATQMGRIGASLASIDTRGTPLQRQLGQLVRRFAWVALALSGATRPNVIAKSRGEPE